MNSLIEDELNINNDILIGARTIQRQLEDLSTNPQI